MFSMHRKAARNLQGVACYVFVCTRMRQGSGTDPSCRSPVDNLPSLRHTFCCAAAAQAFSVQPSELQAISSADLACTKRCTYLQLGRMQPRPVNVVGYSFVTFDRAVAVAVEVQRGWAGRSAGHVKLRQMQWKQTQAASGGLVQLLQPFKVRCSFVSRYQQACSAGDCSADFAQADECYLCSCVLCLEGSLNETLQASLYDHVSPAHRTTCDMCNISAGFSVPTLA